MVDAPPPASDSVPLDTVLALADTTAAARSALDAALSRVGLWLDDLAMLTIVDAAGAEGLDRAALATRLHTTQSEVIRRVGPMVKLSWLTRSGDGSISLTEGGRALVTEASGLAANRSESWMREKLSDDEIATLAGLLARLQ